MKNLIAFTLVLLCGFALAGQPSKAPDLSLNLKRAHKVDPKDVKLLPGNKAMVVAVLTYDDGTRAKCEFEMDWKPTTLKDRQGIEFVPKDQRCWPIK